MNVLIKNNNKKLALLCATPFDLWSLNEVNKTSTYLNNVPAAQREIITVNILHKNNWQYFRCIKRDDLMEWKPSGEEIAKDSGDRDEPSERRCWRRQEVDGGEDGEVVWKAWGWTTNEFIELRLKSDWLKDESQSDRVEKSRWD